MHSGQLGYLFIIYLSFICVCVRRHVESLLRIAEANARMRLSPTVSSLDVDFAIAAVLSSFLSAQKFAVQQRLSREFARSAVQTHKCTEGEGSRQAQSRLATLRHTDTDETDRAGSIRRTQAQEEIGAIREPQLYGDTF